MIFDGLPSGGSSGGKLPIMIGASYTNGNLFKLRSLPCNYSSNITKYGTSRNLSIPYDAATWDAYDSSNQQTTASLEGKGALYMTPSSSSVNPVFVSLIIDGQETIDNIHVSAKPSSSDGTADANWESWFDEYYAQYGEEGRQNVAATATDNFVAGRGYDGDYIITRLGQYNSFGYGATVVPHVSWNIATASSYHIPIYFNESLKFSVSANSNASTTLSGYIVYYE